MLQAELKVLEGKFQGKAIPLNTKKFLVGREQDCHLRPNSDMVSRHHCVFIVDDFAVRLRDLGSTNGTKVNGELIRTETVLNDGDQISIGKLDLQFCLRRDEAAATVELIAPSSLSGFEVPVPQSESETNYEIPQFEPPNTAPAGTGIAGDTAIFGVSPTPPPGYPLGMPMGPGGFLPQPVYPGQPMAGYPQYPQQSYGMPMGYPAGYPPMYPGGPMPGYPQMPYQQPYPGQPAVSVAAPPDAAEAMPTKLPDPESTGIKIPAPVAPVAGAPAQPEMPSNSAADIIKQYMQRRTTK
ncbi:MAG: FHA domain-containing protein [Planctomycetaceae bacterium]|nr:FHA domain-containing protein [Planctomycetaceae bacterium]